jgi:competence protein ComFC
MNLILDILFPKYCLSCNQEGEYWCASCKRKPVKVWNGRLDLRGDRYFDEIVCLGDYEDEILGVLIKNCKYRFVKDLSKDLGIFLAQGLLNNNLQGTITSVPLSKKRERWRGFNQAAEIARVAARQTNLSYQPCLQRIKHKKAQAKLSELERLHNMNGCFELIGKVPEKVILIDDVVTTGATVNECAKVLRLGGARYITVVALAKG